MFDFLEVKKFYKMTSSLIVTLIIWSYWGLIKIPIEDNFRELWGWKNQWVINLTAELYQNDASDIDDEGNHWVWLPAKNVYWILSQAEASPAKSLFRLPCSSYSLSLDVVPIHLGIIKYFYNESDAGDRSQIDDSGGGSLKCSRSSHWDDKKSYVCWKIYRQAVHRHLFGLQKVV